MNIDTDRLLLFSSLKRKHNIFIGVISILAVIAFLWSQFYNSQLISHTYSAINILVIIDFSLIIALVIFLPKNSFERGVLVNLNTPLFLMILFLYLFIPAMNIFINIPAPLPFSIPMFLFILYPLFVMDRARQAYWEDKNGRLKTEGESAWELLTDSAQGAMYVSWFVLFLIIREVLKAENDFDKIVICLILAVNFPVFVSNTFINIRYLWMEKPYTLKQAVFAIILNIVILIISIWFLIAYPVSLLKYIPIILILIYMYATSTFVAISVLNRIKSNKIFVIDMLIDLPILFFLILVLGIESGLVKMILNVISQKQNMLANGLIWVIGAFVGSALFSLIVYSVQRKTRRYTKKDINSITIDDIFVLPGISNDLATAII